MGNRGKMAGNSKVCIGFQSQPILPESIVFDTCSSESVTCVDLVYRFFEFISYTFQRESVKYINLGKISWLPAILP